VSEGALFFPGSVEQVCYHSRPACLVAGSDACTCISMKVLVERNAIAPVWVMLKDSVSAKHRSAALLVAQKDAGEAVCEFLGDLPQSQALPRASGKLNQILVTV